MDEVFRALADPSRRLLDSLNAGDINGYRMQKRFLRSSGEVVWADLTVAVLKDQSDRVLNYISIMVDIGETKQQEDRLNFLLNELAHRSKNLLTIIRAAAHRIAASSATALARPRPMRLSAWQPPSRCGGPATTT